MYISEQLLNPDERRLRLSTQLGVQHVVLDNRGTELVSASGGISAWDAGKLADYRKWVEGFDLKLDVFALDVVHPSTPFKSLKDLVDYGKANPGKLSYGFTHAASGHMAMELFKQTASECPAGARDCKPLFMVGIPYRGGGPMMTDILGGTIPMMFINQDVALQHIKAGKLRPLAVTSAQRNPLYPDVPTIAELGYKGFEALSWSGLSAPKGTPQPNVDKLEAALSQAMQSPAVKQRMESQGFVVPPQGSKPYAAFVKDEIDRWTKVIKVAGIQPE